MQERNKRILTYAILPIVFTGVLSSSTAELVLGKKKEEEPHIPHQEFVDKGFFRNAYLASINSSASVVNTFEQFLDKN